MDAVITYVNGNDKLWIADYNKYVKKKLEDARYRDLGTLPYLIKGIRKFMPFIDKIFLVVSGVSQVPNDIDLTDVRLVYHNMIMPEKYLPCFNSCTIEMFLHNIPGLGEEFIYFNDDTFVIKPMDATDFFVNGKPVLNPHLITMSPFDTFRVFQENCVNSTILIRNKFVPKYPANVYIRQEHIMRPMLKSTYKKVWDKCASEIYKSLTRTRHNRNCNAYLFNNYDYMTGNYVQKELNFKFIRTGDSLEYIVSCILDSEYDVICLNDNYPINGDNKKHLLNAFSQLVAGTPLYKLETVRQSYYDKTDIDDKLYVSFTSWTKRIKNCKHTIDLMMQQTLKPTKIILNLAEEEFPNKENDLPIDLVKEAKQNNLFEIYWVKENTNVWKKIIPTMNRFPNDLVLSIDDDIEYPSNYIEEMYKTYCKYNKEHPVVGYEYRIDNNFCHSGPFTLTSKRFYGTLLDDIFNELVYPTLKNKKWQSDIVYYKVAHANNVNYVMCNSIDCKYLYKTSELNKENRYSVWTNEYKKERTENIKLIDSYINSIDKELKIAVCAIAKNENLYVREWVEWNKTNGICKIFLYDNNNIDGEQFNEVIDDYIKDGFVDVINVRGVHKSLKKNYAEETKYHGTQQDCYEECFNAHKKEFDFMIFIDIDEFIQCPNINMYLNKHLKLGTDVVLLNWTILSDSDQLGYSNEPMLKRFTVKSKRQYNQVKSIVNCHINKKMKQIDAHLALFENAVYRDSAFNTVNPEYKKHIVLDNCYINHFFTKSAEEWTLRKYHQTSATGKDYFNTAFDRRIGEFFSFNKVTKEKQDIINRTIKLIDKVNNKVVVSLTSFGDRLYNDAYIAIQSILNQTVKPNKICLTLFNEDLKYVPETIQKLIDNGTVELIVANKNLKPHLKYFYAMQKYRDCIVITIDDDHIYEATMIEKLLETHKKHPTCVVARRVHLIKRYGNGELLPYKQWEFEYSKQVLPGQNLFATGVGGVLYPADILELSDKNLDDIYKCINADDIYLKWLEVKKHINTVWSPNTSFCGKNINSASSLANRLQDTNLRGTGNDDYLKIFKI